jgi:hypothetical protein
LRNSAQSDRIVRPPTVLTVILVAPNSFHKGNSIVPVAYALLRRWGMMRVRIAGMFLSALILSAVVDGSASSITAKSCNAIDVQAALNAASAGDTVNIPAGTCTWTSKITWTAPADVTVRGAGTLVLGGGDATVIVDNYATNASLLDITANSTGTLRLTGLTFRGGTGVLKDSGIVMLRGPGTVRLDHLHLDVTTYNPPLNLRIMWIGDRVFGVLDHSIIDAYANSAIYFYNGQGPDGAGNTSWASPTAFGSADFFFMEDNLFRGTAAYPIRIGDVYSASRVVWRFNTIQGGAGLEVHATGHAGDDRGARAMEGYGNRFIVTPGAVTPAYDMADLSSGTSLIWGNSADSDALKNFFVFNVTRKNNDTYSQQPTPTSWGYCGTAFNGTGSTWDGNKDSTTGYPCLDQPGRGQGDLLSLYFPSKVDAATAKISWPNQALEPIYVWNNVGTPHPGYGGSIYANVSNGRVVANRDYYPQASGVQASPSFPFDGTVGTGWGSLANRPATCTAGVGYFATDQGSWNGSASNPQGVNFAGADGLLYKCTSTNSWTLYYTPYTYPHPLNRDGGVSLSPPTNLRISG